MHWRRLIVLGLAALAWGALAPSPAAAQVSGQPILEVDDASGDDAPAGTYEIGGYLGLRGGGRVTPGGVSLGGTFLYRVASGIWSDSSVGVTLAGTEPGCFLERDGERFCDHGVFGGSGLSARSGIRLFFAENRGVTPYARTGIGFEYIAFGDDGLDGVAIPIYLGAGVRAPVDDRVSVGGAALVQAGVAFFDQQIGTEPYVSLSIMATVEFDLD